MTGESGELDRLRAALRVAGLGVWDWDVPTGGCHVTPALLELTGVPQCDAPSTMEEFRGWLHPDDAPRVTAALREHLGGRCAEHRCDYRARHRDGHWVWIEERALVMAWDDAGEARRVVGTCADVTERMARLRGATWLALHDPLTSLPNRALFARHLSRARAEARRTRGRVGLLLLDLDRFKDVNDRHGHLAGDRLLVQLAGRLRHSVRRSDTVARLGGDEFAVLVAGPNPLAPATVADRIVGRLREPFVLDGAPHLVTASCGLDEEGRLQRADAALYAAKAAGGACWRRSSAPAAVPLG